jgi:RNA polymerase sigma-70 factor (ECF subfamily)
MNNDTLRGDVSDDQLIVRIAQGDGAALSMLFRRRQGDVYRVAMLMTGSVAAAEDVTQDVFLAVIEDAGRFEPGRASATAWLCGIARNYARRRFDGERRIRPLPDADDSLLSAPMTQNDPLDAMASAQQIELLRRAVLRLPFRYREVIVLCDLQELSYADAATVLECSIGTVRSRLHRGRALLTAKMRAHDRAPVDNTKNSRCLA